MKLPGPVLLRQEPVLGKDQVLPLPPHPGCMSASPAGMPGFASATPPPCPLPSWPVEGVMTVLSLLKRSLTLDLAL